MAVFINDSGAAMIVKPDSHAWGHYGGYPVTIFQLKYLARLFAAKV